MESFKYPEVTIITVNYNGKGFLSSLFNSIKNLDYPPGKIQAILVDNASTDGSKELVKERFPWVDILELDRNCGYAGGNNAGLKASRGKYVALINNDCVVDSKWLISMVEAAIKKNGMDNPGALCSKVLFYYDYIPLRFYFGNAASPPSLKIENIGYMENGRVFKMDEEFFRYIKLLDGFYPVSYSNYKKGRVVNASSGACMAMPVFDGDKDLNIGFIFDTGEKIELEFDIEDINMEGNKAKAIEIFKKELTPGRQLIDLNIKKQHFKHKRSLVNSCGLEINKDFYARDRYANCWDDKNLRDVQEVFSPTGSSLLINKKMLGETGYFDSRFFTYYEDVDLFWRARLIGYKHYFVPGSIARHHHCGTGSEWSYSFSYHVLRNRILTIFKCGSFAKFLKCYFSFILSTLFNTAFYIISFLKGKKQKRPDIKARIRILFEFFYLLFLYMAKRARIRNNRMVYDDDIEKWMIDF